MRTGKAGDPPASRPETRSGAGAAGAASPLLIFAALAGLIVLAAGTAFLLAPQNEQQRPTRSGDTPSPDVTDLSLTDQQAIARLSELDRIRIRALEERNARLLDLAFTPDSPARRRLRKSIRTLLKDQVVLEHRRYDVEKSKVLANGPQEIRIRQHVLVHVEFTGEKGQRLTQGPGKERQVLVTTLKPLGDEWFFFDGRIIDAESISSR